MATRGLPYALLFLILLFTLPGAFAVVPTAPSAVVAQIMAVVPNTSPTAYTSTVNITFMFSPEDPDQNNGAFNYSFYLSASTYGTCIGYPTGWLPFYNRPIVGTGRVGWGSFEIGATRVCGVQDDFGINMTAADGADFSVPSCIVNISAPTLSDHDQCGYPQIESPGGIAAAVVAKPSNASSTINITWPLSTSDPDPLNGSFDYMLKYNYFPPSGPPSLNVTLFGAHYTSGGYESYNQTFGLGGPVTVNLWVYAADPLTRQWSNNTCIATINAQNLYESNGCGSMASYSYTPGGQVGATLPGFDMDLFASQTGLSLTLAGYIVGAIVTALIVLGAWKVAGTIGACIGFAGSISVTALMGLLPFWIIIVIFMAAVSIVILLVTKGSPE